MYHPSGSGCGTVRPAFTGEETTDRPASSTIIELDEEQRILELARMSGGVEISETTLQHARQTVASAQIPVSLVYATKYQKMIGEIQSTLVC